MNPPDWDAIHPDTGFAFQLTDEAFNRWLSATLGPEDTSEFVHLHHGTLGEARFVCAMDYLTNVRKEPWSSDNVLRAYFLARNEPIDMKDTHARTNAFYLSESPAVAFLTDRVRSRSRRISEERIATLVTGRIEEVFERSRGLEGKERIETERLALEAGLKFLANQSRERGQESERRAKKAIQNAIEKSANSEYNANRLPSLAEARLHLAMLVEGHGADTIAELVKEVTPIELPGD